MHDQLRDAWRGLWGASGTTGLSLAILTLGIAAATVTFSVVDAIVLRRLPLPDAKHLVAIARVDRQSPRLGFHAPQDLFTWQEQVPAFEGLAATESSSLTLEANGATERLATQRVTANLFDVLKVRPALGQSFTGEQEIAGHDQVVVLSHALWMRRFGGDSAVLGRTITFGRQTRQVIGVMPQGFTYPVGPAVATEAWVPFVPRVTDRDQGSPGRGFSLQLVGRLKSGATIEQARDQVIRATDNVIAAYPGKTAWRDSRPVVMPLHDYVVGSAQRWLLLVLGAVALVLVIAYVNVANLLLARATSRARELAIRAALGAGRARIAKMLALESLMLSLAAAAMGILLASWGVSIATANLPAGLARASTIALDLRVLAVAIIAAIGNGLVFGVVPAWHGSRADVMSVLKEGGGAVGASRGRARWQRALLVAELGFVVTLLVATALFVTSFVNVLRADLGFAPGRLIGVPVDRSFSSLEAARGPAGAAFVAEVLDRVGAVPGVTGAALVNGGLPLYGQMVSYSIKIDGYGSAEGADMVVIKRVTPGFFDVAGVRMLGGRTFDGSERVGTPLVAILNDEAARRFFRGRSPVGEVIQFRGPTTIVGVVSSVRLSGPEVPLRPEMYVPILQEHVGETFISGDVIVRLNGPSASTSAAIVAAVKDFNPPARIIQARDLDQRFRELTADRRFNAIIMSVFALLALAIAGAGVYGLTSFVVAQQFRAIGLRLALGATTGRVFRGVLTDTGRLLAMGMTIGLFGGWGISRLFRSVIFGITGNEGWLYATVALTLALICLLAALLPAHRASRVDPLVALRSE